MQGQAAAAMATPLLELQRAEKGCAGSLGLREVREARDRCPRAPAWVEGVAPWGGWQP